MSCNIFFVDKIEKTTTSSQKEILESQIALQN